MRIKTLSPKQRRLLTWAFREPAKSDCRAVICDGSVRSGKTVIMIFAFVAWAMRTFCEAPANFAVCGKTVQSAERNVIRPLQELEDLSDVYTIRYHASAHILTVNDGQNTNRFYVFGGKDESSYQLIQGITLSGILYDEVALMPQSFVEQGNARTLSVERAKLWFNCNPESPSHWFYQSWVRQPERRRALHLHFTMEDNPILSPAMIEEAKALYTGTFYDRYILGLWVAAEGIIYRPFADSIAAGDGRFLWPQDRPLRPWRVQLGVDFGGTGSQHAFVAVGILPGYRGVVGLYSRRIDASGQDATALCQSFLAFASDVCARWGEIHAVYCDSAEQVLIQSIRSALSVSELAWLTGRVYNARKAPILDRIRLTSLLMGAGRFWVLPGAQSLTDALASALWDGKTARGKDIRLDDGTTDVDSLDAFEYAIERDYRRLLPPIAGQCPVGAC